MQFPGDFPHTRREQYLVSLPDELLTDGETLAVASVLDRARRFHNARIVQHIAAMLPADPSEKDVVLALAAVISSDMRERRWRRGPLVRQ